VCCSYYFLIRHELNQSNVRRAYLHVKEMVEKKVKFAYTTVELVVDSCEAAGFRAEAEDLRSLVNEDTLLNAGGQETESTDKDRSEFVRDYYTMVAQWNVAKTPSQAQARARQQAGL